MRAGLIRVGALKGPHGLKGAVKAKVTLDDPDLLLRAGPLYLEDGRPLTVVRWAPAGQGLLSLTLAGITRIDDAQGLAGPVYLDRAAWPEPEGEVYLDVLVGRDAVDGEGRVLGKVAAVADLPAGPALEIDAGGKPALVPVHPEFMTLGVGGAAVALTALGAALLRLAPTPD